MTPQNRTLASKNRTLGGGGGQELPKKIGQHLWMLLCNNYLGSNNRNLYHVYLESLHFQALIMEEI
jgi:hypothetical protein